MGTYYNTITTTILNDSKIFAANDSSTHNNERIKCDNDYQPTQLNPSLPDSSANWNNSKVVHVIYFIEIHIFFFKFVCGFRIIIMK